MTEEAKTVSDILEELALKIMMVEPGDLSVVGELVSLLEELSVAAGEAELPMLKRLASDLESAVGQIIMAELDDSAENFDCLGKCIGYLQELNRKKDQDEEAVGNFYASLKATGFDVKDIPVASDNTPQDDAPPEDVPAEKESEKDDTVPDFLQDVELLTGFIEETTEHLEAIEVNVLELESNPGDEDIINNIFRPFHTIKGVSGFLNLTKIQRLAHCTENLLDDVRNGIRQMDSSVIDVVLKVGDFLRGMVDNIKLVLEEGPENYINFDIEEHVAWVKNIQAGKTVSLDASAGQVLSEGENESSEASGEESDAAAPVASGNVAPQEAGKGRGQSSVTSVVKKSGVVKKTKPGASIKVDIEKLDGLVNAVGELVIMQAMVRANKLVATISDPKLTKDFAQLSRITSDLQKTAMSMRMVPIRQTFQKMIRLVRDLSKKTGKKVDLVMEGEETEIDRNMVDSIYDPLVHMMRNSVDHGVQLPAERQAAGQSPTGTVSLRAYQKGGSMVLEIEDDGQGLNTAKVRKKAIERGLIAENDTLSDHELNNLIFLPGFSTADQVTDVSGRGVGMDVVKKGVEKLRGKVEVYSEPGKGCQFVIRLPLTLAIIDGIIVRVGDERYIIPTTAIHESLKPKREQYTTVHGRGEALVIRDTLVPIIRLADLFGGGPADTTDPCEGIVVVIEAEGKQRAILVDELLGKQEVVIKNLGGLQDIKGVAGGTILGDGRVGLILDLAGLVATGGFEVKENVNEEMAKQN